MLDYLYRLSNLSIFIVLAVITIALAVGSILLSKRYLFFRLKYRDNATISSISSLIGIIYGVLVGFIALYLIDNNDQATNAVLREASAVANVYRDSQWLTEPTQGQLQKQLENYIDKVIHVEWPLMREGKEADLSGDLLIQNISRILKNYSVASARDTLIVKDVLTELKTLYNARHERIGMSVSQLSPEIWEVILVGTILIIGINYAFRVNFYLHLFAISAFAIMAASMLFLLVTLDRPFQGEFIIEPTAFQAVYKLMQAERGS
ncbi:MAG TPA: DUF4239 domain-containing protein [Gammaproteobacteria bacterium]|nr:DUF4239 domain-containing protein [Gammaproteobacteria bacterium]